MIKIILSGILKTLKWFVYTGIVLVLLISIIIVFSSISRSNRDKRAQGYHITEGQRRDFTKMPLMGQIDRKALRKILFWFIETGVGEFYKTRDKNSVIEYVKNRGYHIFLGPIIDNYYTYKEWTVHILARIVIRSRFFYTELWSLAQVEHGGKIYEYWAIREAARKGKYDYKNCEFIVTEAESKEGTRKIIYSSPQFFSKYPVSEDFILFFPANRLPQLNVHSYPECYQETKMKEVKAILDAVDACKSCK